MKICSKIIGVRQGVLCSLWEYQVVKQAKCIISQFLQVLSPKCSLIPSGCCLCAPSTTTNRFSETFVPSAIRLLNSDSSHFKQVMLNKSWVISHKSHQKNPKPVSVSLTVASFCTESSDAPSEARPISWENWAKLGSANSGTWPSSSWHVSLHCVRTQNIRTYRFI